MLHEIQVEQHEPQAEEMAKAIETCIHCGFCLPTCPTYVALGQEMDSPRGRIFLMKEVLEGNMEVEEAADGGPLSFEAADVLARVDAHGDLFAPTLTVEQQLPLAGG